MTKATTIAKFKAKYKTKSKAWLKKMNIQNYTVLENGKIDVDGEVDIRNKSLTVIPVQFNQVNGNFLCDHNQLTTLNGAPKKVMGNFGCSENKLTTLKWCPKKVKGNFNCNNNIL